MHRTRNCCWTRDSRQEVSVYSLCARAKQNNFQPVPRCSVHSFICFPMVLSTKKCSLPCLLPKFLHHPAKFNHYFLCELVPDISPLFLVKRWVHLSQWSHSTWYIGKGGLQVWKHRQYTCLSTVSSNTYKIISVSRLDGHALH